VAPADQTLPDSPWPAYRRPDGSWLPPRREGLVRVLAKAGYGARNRAQALVHDGRLTIDGRVVRDPGQPVGPDSEVRLDGEVLREAERRYLVMHKPAGVECQPQGASGRDVGRFLGSDALGLEPAGRLATRSRGLLLLSNDLWWNTRVSANDRLERGYEVLIGGMASRAELDVLCAGMMLPSLGHVRADQAVVVGERPGGSLVRLTMRGGHDRQIRGAFTALRREVLRLVRVSLGPVSLQGLAGGQHRSLSAVEIRALAGTPGTGD
jgi:23S rRNA pseudouridine2605 synthase